MLAYLTWHRPHAGVQRGAYERALEGFHRSLAHRPPSGFRGCSAFRVVPAPREGAASRRAAAGGEAGAYEDWYLLDGWDALGVLEEAAVSRGHVRRHDAVSGMAAEAVGGVYRLSEGQPQVQGPHAGVWVTPVLGAPAPGLADLLADGADPQRSALWRRCLGLGRAPQYCLLAADLPAGVAPRRLPPGWTAEVQQREELWHM